MATTEETTKRVFQVAISIGNLRVAYLDLEPEHEGKRVSTPIDEHGLVLDFSKDGRLVGIEFLNVKALPKVGL